MRSKCKDIYHSSTLPSILETYQSSKIENEEDKRKKTQSHQELQEMNTDQEAQARHQALLEQRHLEAYRNMHRLRDALCHHYSALLKDKVHSQRQQQQQLLLHKHDKNTTKSKNETKWVQSQSSLGSLVSLSPRLHLGSTTQPSKSHYDCHTSKKQRKLVYSLLQHNDSYLRSIPKSSHYMISDLQNKLTQRGHLKSQQDLKDFYLCIDYTRGPTQLQRSLQEIEKNVVCSGSVAHLMMTGQKTRRLPRNPTLHEDRGPPLQSAMLEGGSGMGEELSDLQEEELEETERMFPKMKVPTFVTLQPRFLRDLRRKMPHVVIPAEIPEKNAKAEINLRLLRQMRDRSFANMAFSKRLLDRERLSLYWQEEPSIPDLMSLVFLSIDSKQEDMGQTTGPLLPFVVQSRRSTSNNDDPSHSPQDLDKITCPSHHAFLHIVSDDGKAEPLSMEDVCQQGPVQIIDHDVKMWSNYTDDTDT